MKKIAADRNYRMLKEAGLGDLKDFAMLWFELHKYILKQGLHLYVPISTIYNHGSDLLLTYNQEIKDHGETPRAFATALEKMMELNLIGHKDILQGA